ncbi:MAG: DNA glycosylase [Clostridia bacterium]
MRKRIAFLNLQKTADSGQCFLWERMGEQAYRIRHAAHTLTIRQLPRGLFEMDCTPEEWESIWSPYFDLGVDYGAYCAGIDPADAYLRAAARSARGIRILRQELWETMVCFLVSQNNNIPRIKGTLNRLCALYGGFPSPQQLARAGRAELEGCGLGYRAAYLPAAAAQYLRDCEAAPARAACWEDARAYLQTYAGIGPKVAECICLFGLGHKAAFPVDTWVKRILAAHYAEGFPAERYPGFQGVLQQFMFYYERSLLSKFS